MMAVLKGLEASVKVLFRLLTQSSCFSPVSRRSVQPSLLKSRKTLWMTRQVTLFMPAAAVILAKVPLPLFFIR